MKSIVLAALALVAASSSVFAAEVGHHHRRHHRHHRHARHCEYLPAVGGIVPCHVRYSRVRHMHAPSGYAFARAHGAILLIDTETSPPRVADVIW